MAAGEKLPLLLGVEEDNRSNDGDVPTYNSRQLVPHSLSPHVDENNLIISGGNNSVVSTEQDSIVAIFVVAFDTRSGKNKQETSLTVVRP